MIKDILSLFSIRFPRVVAYMLQSSEYEIPQYLRWLWRTRDFSSVMYRKSLDETKKAKLVTSFLYVGIAGQVAVGFGLIIYSLSSDAPYTYFGAAILLVAPIFWAHIIVIPIAISKILLTKPKDKRDIIKARSIFQDFKGPKIAVTGSYGKTTVKELLRTVLSEGFDVAATPGNKNVLVSHARFAENLNGNEDLLIIEYGEGRPGDVAMFADYTKPSHVVVTGIAPAHMDKYKTIDAAAKDIFSATDYVDSRSVYVNSDSRLSQKYIKPDFSTYGKRGVGEWKVSDIRLDIAGMKFVLSRDKITLNLKTSLIGEHLIGPVCLAAIIAYDLGLDPELIELGVAKTKPYEHRMQPYPLNGGWVIDDTYNGNLEGIKAGLGLLSKLAARKKWYVTPGLVEQGDEKESVHKEIGRLISAARPDIVVLMKNSTTSFIEEGLKDGGYKGEVRIEKNPLNFYKNIDQLVAKDDLMLMQNDWTDNYN